MIADAPTRMTRTVTLTLDVPADLAARLDALPPDTVHRFALAALPAVVEAAEEAGDSDADDTDELPADIYERFPFPQESLADDLRAGFADIDAGRVTDGETFFAELRAYAERK